MEYKRDLMMSRKKGCSLLYHISSSSKESSISSSFVVQKAISTGEASEEAFNIIHVLVLRIIHVASILIRMSQIQIWTRPKCRKGEGIEI